MKKEFNLSEKAVVDAGNSNPIPNYYWEYNIKEFIKIIETEATKPNLTMGERIEIIRKSAGERLTQ